MQQLLAKKYLLYLQDGTQGYFQLIDFMEKLFYLKAKHILFGDRVLARDIHKQSALLLGVMDAVQYTIPVEEALEVVRSGETPDFTTREKHTRLCYVVADKNADKEAIEQEIKNMPNYFADYDTTVNFITIEEFNKNHRKMPHGGFVITSGNTTKGNNQIMEFSVKLDNNPEFTASIMIAYARAAHRLYKKGETGARTVFDISPAMLSPKTSEELRKGIL